MALLTPKISNPENANVAFRHSWVDIDNDQNRPLFAQAVLPMVNQFDVEVFKDTSFHYGNYNKLVVLESTTFANLTANNNVVSSGLAAVFPPNFQLESSVQGFKLSSGSVIAYK